MDEEQNTTLPPADDGVQAPTAVQKRSFAARLGRAVWNGLAVVGLVGLIAMSFGLVYGYTQFKDASPQDLSAVEPVNPFENESPFDPQNPLTPNEGKANMRFEPNFVEARLTPIPPLQNGALAISVLNVMNPVEKLMIFSNMDADAQKNLVPSATDWLVNSDFNYSCASRTVAQTKFKPNPAMEGEVTDVRVCKRPLNEDEARIAQAKTGYTSFYSFEFNKSFLVIQVMVGADDEASAMKRTNDLLSTFTWQ